MATDISQGECLPIILQSGTVVSSTYSPACKKTTTVVSDGWHLVAGRVEIKVNWEERRSPHCLRTLTE